MRIHRAQLIVIGIVAGFAGAATGAPSAQVQTPTVDAASARTSSSIKSDALDHLSQADQLLKSVPPKVQDDARKWMDQLRKHFADLMTAYRTRGDAIGPPILAKPNQPVTDDVRERQTSEAMAWPDIFSAVEGDLSMLIGAGSALNPSTVAGTGTLGNEPAPVGNGATQPGVPVGTTGVPPSSTPAGPAAAGANPSAPGAPATPGSVASPNATTPSPAGTAINPTPPADNVTLSNNSQPAGAAQPSGAAGIPGVTGAGVLAGKVSTIGVKDLDPKLRETLEQMRLNLELFYTYAINPSVDGAAEKR
jgi:hypothetical protein